MLRGSSYVRLDRGPEGGYRDRAACGKGAVTGGVVLELVAVASCLSICSHFGASADWGARAISRWNASGDWNCADGLGADTPTCECPW